MYGRYEEEIKNLKSQALFRELKDFEKDGKYILRGGKKLLNLSSNDYLAIAQDLDIAQNFLSQFRGSLGSASSRLLTGGAKVYSELESMLAELFNKEKALIFNNGYHANIGIVSSLVGKRDAVFCDKLNHASIIDGIKLGECAFHRYKHLDYEHLEELLIKHREKYDNALIVTESVFSMDGDIADLNELVRLKEKYNAIFIVDEAHAFGVFGKSGLGIVQEQGSIDDIDIIIATFGKAIGSVGAFACGNAILIDYMINKARPLIFSTALPEINIAFSKYVISEIFPQKGGARNNLLKTARDFKKMLEEQNLNVKGDSHIISVITGENQPTVDCCNKLQKAGFYLLPIRYPTVPKGTSRVRFSLRSDIALEELASIEF